MIYLDNAATTPLDGDVFDAMTPYLRENFGNPSSQHAYGRAAAAALLSARDSVAEELGCDSSEVYFLSGATEACNAVMKGACLAAKERGRHIIISSIEHSAVSESANDLKKFGFEASVVPCGESGVIDARDVEREIRPDTVFCSVMAANNETGSVQPVEEIASLCAERKIFFFSDCVQYIGYKVPDLKNISSIAITAHKIYGPKGIGALYIKRGSFVQRFISGGGQEMGFRGGTPDVAGAVGLARALQKLKEREENNKKTAAVRDYFLNRIFAEIDGVHINGENTLPNFANLSFDGCNGDSLLFNLDLHGIAASRGSACTAGASEPSHTLVAMGLGERARSAIRFSFGKYNTVAEADGAVEILKSVTEKLRNC